MVGHVPQSLTSIILDAYFTGKTIKAALMIGTHAIDRDADIDFHTAGNLQAHEVANGLGYTTGGVTVTLTVTKSDANDTVIVDITNPQWTASGGSIVANKCVVYVANGTTDPVIKIIDFEGDQTATNGNNLTVTIDAGGLVVYDCAP